MAEATCEAPATCVDCGYTEGKALGHNASKATCTEASRCSRCGSVISEALGHTTSLGICGRCHEKQATEQGIKDATNILNDYTEGLNKLTSAKEKLNYALKDSYSRLSYCADAYMDFYVACHSFDHAQVYCVNPAFSDTNKALQKIVDLLNTLSDEEDAFNFEKLLSVDKALVPLISELGKTIDVWEAYL